MYNKNLQIVVDWICDYDKDVRDEIGSESVSNVLFFR